MSQAVFRRAVSARTSLRPTALPIPLRQSIRGIRHASSLPHIGQTSFWKSLIPKPLRSSSTRDDAPKRVRSKGWNPATFFIVIFLFIGSMAIQMIVLKKEFEAFMRRSEVRIGLLREVVERIQKGEEVDVEKVLGTGDPQKELEWEDVLKELVRDDASKNQKKKQQEPASTSASTKATPTNEAEIRQAVITSKAPSRATFF